VEAWRQAQLAAQEQDGGARGALEEVLLAEYVDEDGRDLLGLHGQFYGWKLVLEHVFGLLGLGFAFWNGVGTAEGAYDCYDSLVFYSG